MSIIDPHFTMPGQDMPPQEFLDIKTQQGQINWLAQGFSQLNENGVNASAYADDLESINGSISAVEDDVTTINGVINDSKTTFEGGTFSTLKQAVNFAGLAGEEVENLFVNRLTQNVSTRGITIIPISNDAFYIDGTNTTDGNVTVIIGSMTLSPGVYQVKSNIMQIVQAIQIIDDNNFNILQGDLLNIIEESTVSIRLIFVPNTTYENAIFKIRISEFCFKNIGKVYIKSINANVLSVVDRSYLSFSSGVCKYGKQYFVSRLAKKHVSEDETAYLLIMIIDENGFATYKTIEPQSNGDYRDPNISTLKDGTLLISVTLVKVANNSYTTEIFEIDDDGNVTAHQNFELSNTFSWGNIIEDGDGLLWKAGYSSTGQISLFRSNNAYSDIASLEFNRMWYTTLSGTTATQTGTETTTQTGTDTTTMTGTDTTENENSSTSATTNTGQTTHTAQSGQLSELASNWANTMPDLLGLIFESLEVCFMQVI